MIIFLLHFELIITDCKTIWEAYQIFVPAVFSECVFIKKPDTSDDFMQFFRRYAAQQALQHNFPFGFTYEQKEMTLFFFCTTLHVHLSFNKIHFCLRHRYIAFLEYRLVRNNDRP